jgi:hypothetical protein
MLWLGLWRTARNKENTLVTKIEEGGYTQPSFRILGFSASRTVGIARVMGAVRDVVGIEEGVVSGC